MSRAMVAGAVLLLAMRDARAQDRPPQTIERRRSVASDVALKIWIPAGTVRLIGWDHDSLAVEGTIPAGESFFFGGSDQGVKMGIEDPPPNRVSAPATLVIHVPKRSRLSVKTVSGDIVGQDVSGWFNTVGGRIQLAGRAREVQAETLDGAIDLNVAAPWVRARTGSGRLTLAGTVEDLSASTVSGNLSVSSGGIERGKLESISGPIVFSAVPARAAVVDFDNHSGAVEIRLAGDVAADVELTTVAGSITNRLNTRKPIAGRQGRGQELAFATDVNGARISARTFKGHILLARR
ncbi:MAG TPA: DUF4097 family beta strand repeat-containing protein [Gemmatimonadaceae bacterium]|nr:DUF4097 family beta strand repeat-containing protein [Gemmatimonadaceae bacterium]